VAIATCSSALNGRPLAAGWAELVEQLRGCSIAAIGIEASGGYERGAIRALLAADLPVRQVNRIFRAFMAPAATPWMWRLTYEERKDSGMECTREAAMQGFAKSLESECAFARLEAADRVLELLAHCRRSRV
jgi:hypothetical protein